ncbi:MAG: CoB--CoM heterodisulfide reductase iron-sulfur subunit A family protein [bacterium]|nr:CoB--CoM heterodisulfide reductase iron-sulfur subunit A family protein [bacterium]
MTQHVHGSTNGEIRIGVYVCHCGTNIAKMVDPHKVVEAVKDMPGVVIATQYRFMCSDPGQELIRKDIEEHKLNRIVVAACSPLMHEGTFRKAVEAAGLNRYFFEMANIREQVSWVSEDPRTATHKAGQLTRAAVARVRFHEELEMRRVPIKKAVMVIGGGIAGIESALQMADAGFQVYLVEREATIGGHMAKFDKTFPTLDCAACILTPKMVSVGKHPNITLLTWADIESVSGSIGNFKVKVKSKARYVDTSKCNSCGACFEACISRPTPEYRRMTLGGRVFREGRMLDVRDKYILGPKHDLTILTGAQPMPENVPAAMEVDIEEGAEL